MPLPGAAAWLSHQKGKAAPDCPDPGSARMGRALAVPRPALSLATPHPQPAAIVTCQLESAALSFHGWEGWQGARGEGEGGVQMCMTCHD